MIKMNLSIEKKDCLSFINEKIIEGKELSCHSDIQLFDTDKNYDQQFADYYYNLSTLKKTYSFDDIFNNLKIITQAEKKFRDKVEIYIDNELFAIKRTPKESLKFNKNFPKEIIKKYSLKTEIPIMSCNYDNEHFISQAIKIGENEIELNEKYTTIKFETEKELKFELLNRLKNLKNHVIDDYSITLNNKKIFQISHKDRKQTLRMH